MRAIDADALLKRLGDLVDWCRDIRKTGLEQAMCIIQEMPTLTPQNEWISVDERLPEMYGNYICAVKDKNGSVWTIPAQWSLEMKMWVGAFGEIKNIVTHWMYLPAPPTKEGDGK